MNHDKISAYEGTDPYIFVSYSHKDKSIIMDVIEDLYNDGYRIWYDSGIDPGTEWPEEIAKHIKNCSLFIVFVSNNAMKSQNVRQEINFALNLEKNMVVIYIEETQLSDGMSMRLNLIQAIHKYKYADIQKFFSKLVRIIPMNIKNENKPSEKVLADSSQQNRYEIVRMLGQGGMSRVLLAHDKYLDSLCAIKEINKNSTLSNSVYVQSIMNEMNILKKLRHSGIPRVLDFINTDSLIGFVMDYIEGVSLASIVDKNGAQDETVVISWAKQICDIMNYLHESDHPIIVRDIKPGNLLIDSSNKLYMIDFHIAKVYDPSVMKDELNIGSHGFAAPEQYGWYKNMGQSDKRTDIYGFGKTMFQMLTGVNSYELEKNVSVRDANPKVSRALDDIISKCIMFEPNDRYQSFQEVTQDLNLLHKDDKSYATDIFKKDQKSKPMPDREVVPNAEAIVSDLRKYIEVQTENYDFSTCILSPIDNETNAWDAQDLSTKKTPIILLDSDDTE